MSERYWQRPLPMAAVLLAAAGAVALTGCGASGNGAAAAGATSTAGLAATAAKPASFSAAQLRGALLGEVNKKAPISPAEAGAYGSLPDVQTGKQSMSGVKVVPAKCAATSVTGFNSATFAHSPASVVTFRVGQNGVSEVLVAASGQSAQTAMASHLPAGCGHYKAIVGGKSYTYAVKESTVSGVADQARALNVKAVGYASVDVWSVVFRGSGFVGALTVVGSDASEKAAQELARDAYNQAAQSLH